METDVLIAFKVYHDSSESLDSAIEKLTDSLALCTGAKVEAVYADRSITTVAAHSVSATYDHGNLPDLYERHNAV